MAWAGPTSTCGHEHAPKRPERELCPKVDGDGLDQAAV